MAQHITKEAIGIFDDPAKLEKAVSELENTAFARHDLNVIGGRKEMIERFGKDACPPELLEHSLRVPKRPLIRKEEKAIASGVILGIPAYLFGCLAAIAVNPAPGLILIGAVTLGSAFGAGLGASALWALNLYMNKQVKHQLQEGGLILWIRTQKPEQERLAEKILNKYGARQIHIGAHM